MDWTPEHVDVLRQLWGEGLSATKIGRRMKISKNAVVGKAHRLGLSGRPSPIRRAKPAVLGGVGPVMASAEPIVAPVPAVLAGPSVPGPWLPAEIATLTNLAREHRGIATLLAALPGRSEKAIKNRAAELRARGVDLPPIQAVRSEVVPVTVWDRALVAQTPAPTPVVQVTRPVLAATVRPAAIPLRAGAPCQWPTTDEATGRHRFVCQDARESGRVYCARHLTEAHQPGVRSISRLTGMAMRIVRRESVWLES